MTTTQRPSDLEVSEYLSTTRVRVLEATRHIRSPRTSTRTRLAIAGALGIAGATIVAGAAVSVAQHPDDVIQAHAACYETLDLSGRSFQALYSPGASGSADVPGDPLGACSHVWRDGVFTVPGSELGSGGFPVPELVACRGRDGVAAVFPRGAADSSDQALCEALGLAVWDSGKG